MGPQRFIYVVEAKSDLIKIGCSQRPQSRLLTIRSYSPLLTRIIAVWPGVEADERRLHRRFVAHRTHCEWFRIEGPVAGFVASIRGLGIERVEDWSDTAITPELGASRSFAVRSAKAKLRWQRPEFRVEQIIAMKSGRALVRELGREWWNSHSVSSGKAAEIRARVRAEVEAQEAARVAPSSSEAA